ncbi:acyl-CoA dehydrogenase, partial [Butyricicoccus sp. 1XD8-22]
MFTENEMKRITQLSKQMEEAQTILSEILEILYEHKLFKVFAPNALGGLELSLIDGLKTFQQAGVIDGNVGWAVT